MLLDKDRDFVGLVGLGIMGGAIARNLTRSGWRVLGFDISPERRAELAADGVTVGTSAVDVARRAPAVMTSLPSVKALDAVLGEIVAARLPSRVVVEMSTFPLEDKLAAERLLAGAGHTAIDCPISGTGAQAVTGDLVLYPSGDPAVIKALEPMFLGFSRGAYDVGAYGNGSRMKFVANLLVAIHNVAAAEAMLLAERAGLDPDVVIKCISTGAGTSRMFEMRAPLMARKSYTPPTMRIATWMKDMDAIEGFARSLGVPTPMLDTTRPLYERALAEGLGAEDTAAVHAVIGKAAPRS